MPGDPGIAAPTEPGQPGQSVPAAPAPPTIPPGPDFDDDLEGPVLPPPWSAQPPVALRWWRALPRPYKVIGAIATFLIFIFIRFTVDDAFITWRYGVVFARHFQWGYNPSPMPRVEAYTNFLYAVVSAVPAVLHFPVELFFKLVSLAVLGGYLYAVRRVKLPQVQKVALLALALCNPAFVLHLFSGLETVSLALLIALLFSMVYRNGALTRQGYLVALLLALTRPEGVVFAGVAMAWSWIVTRDREQLKGLGAIAWAWAFYWLVRWQYFGSFWPNTFYVKSGDRGPMVTQVFDILDALLPAVVVVLLVVLVAATVRREGSGSMWATWGGAQDATPAVLAVTGALVVLGLYHSSALAQNFVNRFQWQLLFPVALVVLSRPLWRPRVDLEAEAEPGEPTRTADLWGLTAIVIAAIASGADAPSRLGHQLVVAAAMLIIAIAVVLRFGFNLTKGTILAAVGLVVVLSSAPMSEYMSWIAYRSRLQYAHQDMGRAINAAPFKGAVAIGDTGVLPFKIHQPVIDLNGLADSSIAHGTFSAHDLAKAHLDMVIALSSSELAQSHLPSGIGQSVTYSYMQQQGFMPNVGPPFADGYWMNWWIRKEAVTPQLTEALRKVEIRAQQENRNPDAQIFVNHLFDFPFLTNGN